MPIFRIFFVTLTPLVLIGTMISDLFRCGTPSEVLARTQQKSACVPLVVHIFPPSIT